ncbi:MAG: hypothetical protein KBD83_06220 [Gammaproteobacteria bacterium]|nr:hypothetical protein [Gammaproteobacteria bacterium]
MGMLTKDLETKFKEAEALKAGLSESAKAAFDHSMLSTATLCERRPKNLKNLQKLLKKSGKQVLDSLKKSSDFKSTLAQMTGQSETLAASAMVKGLEDWTTSLWSPEKAFAKTQKPKQ